MNNITDNPIATEISAWIIEDQVELYNKQLLVEEKVVHAYSIQNDALHYIYSNDTMVTKITFLEAWSGPLIK